MIKFILNDKETITDAPAGLVLLDFIRYHKNLKGTKIGCREGDCGACTVLVGEIVNNQLRYRSATSCLMAIGNANNKHIVTVEGINMNGFNPVQQAMSEQGATQCGFCTPGFVMSFAGYCLSEKVASEKNAIASIDGNICRCTGYKSIERAAVFINGLFTNRNTESPTHYAVHNKILPEYFLSIKDRLQNLVSNNQTIDNPRTTRSSDYLVPSIDTNNPITNLGGGTDLYVQKHDTMIDAEINFLFDNKSLKGIYEEGNNCFIGASCTVTDLLESKVMLQYFPHFAAYAKLVSSTPIRNIATLAGNFVNASPIGDFTIFFLALDAQLILSNSGSKRHIALRNFYRGYKTLDKDAAEIIEQFYFKLPHGNTKFNFEKVSKRTHLDIASVNTAMKIVTHGDVITEAHISAGGVFAFPKYLENASIFLKGKSISEATILDAIEIAQKEIAPISDARGSETYKRLLLTQLIKAHFIVLFPDKILAHQLM